MLVDTPGAVWLPADTLHFNIGRLEPIRYIVVHTTEGTDSRDWLTTTSSPRVSAHYLLRDEATYQLVREHDTAWHAGRIVGIPTTPLYHGVNPNEESIGIEIEGRAAETIPPVRFQRTIALIRNIRERHGPLPLVGHFELSPGNRTDPGRANFSAIESATEVFDMDEQRLREIVREEVHRAVWGPGDDPNTPELEVTGLGLTFARVSRRIIRTLQGTPRDPGKEHPDDDDPIA